MNRFEVSLAWGQENNTERKSKACTKRPQQATAARFRLPVWAQAAAKAAATFTVKLLFHRVLLRCGLYDEVWLRSLTICGDSIISGLMPILCEKLFHRLHCSDTVRVSKGGEKMPTSKKDGSLASKLLKDSKSTAAEKSVAGSDLAQRKGAAGKSGKNGKSGK